MRSIAKLIGITTVLKVEVYPQPQEDECVCAPLFLKCHLRVSGALRMWIGFVVQYGQGGVRSRQSCSKMWFYRGMDEVLTRIQPEGGPLI